MNGQLEKELYDNLLYELLNNEFINRHLLSKEMLKEFLYSEEVKSHIRSMVEKKDFSCFSTLILIKNLIDLIAPVQNNMEWLMNVYQYALSKSFPHASTLVYTSIDAQSYEIYLKVLKIASQIQKHSNDGTWQSKYPLYFLSQEEINSLENPDEYLKFLNSFDEEYIYEMMKLNQELLGYNTLDHICGVHYLAMFLARQFQSLGLPIDLGRVSGASAGHDIGKYGCTGSEIKRVPYLHYYYTDLWFTRHDILYIRNIALNHSTWDLELENLPLESLILIYSDFRVKNLKDKNGKDTMHFLTLKDAFNVILDKLDNVDDMKLNRYKRVYSKLEDFESFMINIGIEVNTDFSDRVDNEALKIRKKFSYPLMHGQEVVENLKYVSIENNIKLMYKLRTESSLNFILDLARSENDWKNLRQYLQIFEEYSTYLTQKQKLITLNFLYEELTHPEEDIRKKSAELIGVLIAEFDEDYRKELPSSAKLGSPKFTSVDLLNKYLGLFLFPDHKILLEHRKWIVYTLPIMISSLFNNAKSNLIDAYCDVIFKYYDKEKYSTNDNKLTLLYAAKYIPFSENKDSLVIFNYILDMLDSKNSILRIAALDVSRSLLYRLSSDFIFIINLKTKLTHKVNYSKIPAENFLKEKIANQLDLDDAIKKRFSDFCKRDLKKIPDIYLSNLKTATDWIIKKIQVELLLDHSLKHPKENAFYTALHYCNLLKVSAVESVRNFAGDALVRIIPHLSPEQRNDVAIELLRALEIEGLRFAEFIPYSLGQILLFLKPIELDEVTDDLIGKIKQSEPRVKSLILKTIGIVIANYPKYRYMFNEDEKNFKNRLIKMLGILLNGLVNYNVQVKQMAYRVIGKDIFCSRWLGLEQKYNIFKLISKKLLTLIVDDSDEELLFLTKAASLNHIYRFISEYTCIRGKIELQHPDKVAFFPGTFDPFSLSHKEIVKAIKDLGFEVFLAVDEFSWSKQTRPHMIRRNIISMSIADELEVYLFPEDVQINISNNDNLSTLRNAFPCSEIYIVVGSDVLLNASAYKKSKSENSIHSFSHIIFKRNMKPAGKKHRLDDVLKLIDGEIIYLSLAPQYEDISSTRIRDYIDKNMDISSLIDPLVQRYMYENGYYQHEPQYKSPIQTVSVDVEVINNINEGIIDEICSLLENRPYDLYEKLKNFSKKPSARIVALRSVNENNSIVAFSLIHWIRISELYRELQNVLVCEYIRKNAAGRIVLIGGMYINKNTKIKNLEQMLLTETLAFCLSRDYDYAVYKSIILDFSSRQIEDVLRLQGFIKLPYNSNDSPFYVVNMSSPCTLNLDIKTIIKEPFRSNNNINKVIKTSRKRLQEALTKLYPGNLVLSFNRNMMYENIIKKICRENGVPTTPLCPRSFGNSMCVPFGNILKRNIVPNTITKSLHTEKYFSRDLKSYTIGPFPNYLSLENQIRMLKAFDRPVILVDDILHKGYRIRALDPLLNKEGINVQKIIVGILSGMGKELMDIQNRSVDSAYYIPKLKVWFNESLLYPFMGGDTVWQGDYPRRNLIPSINLILPYASPTFIKGTSTSSIFNLSKVCIENALDIMAALESEYQFIQERSLTLGLLGQVFMSPRCPDHGYNMNYDLNLNASHYLKNDLELLSRIEYLLNKD
ncbi:cytidyltransferase [Fonticella tunisiensis]|uniref:nicotinate-nucleotide adenylyltransferase n=1 Tax=Fonticella tunisiensis TaxID=1096341 RepID=A0A4R7KST4_9CLOT|nr:cytidyltransferase [Fonticella tunisiensis]TDT61162.1 nicotinic acid mononucleotide adenylyltransferase [Fonticella tunisiensis]